MIWLTWQSLLGTALQQQSNFQAKLSSTETANGQNVFK